MICLQNISKIYTRKQSSENVIALDNISLTLPDKGFVSILGASGSGKSTLLNIIGGLDTPTSGSMIVDNIPTNKFNSQEWNSYRNDKIGFIFQNCYLIPYLSVSENIAIKLQISNHKYDNINELVEESLKKVDLYEKRNDKPQQLSGGQRQRVAIARAIIGNPVVLLADEPTGSLDSKTGSQIMNLLKELSKEHLVVMVTHNREYADEYSDRIIELKDGHIISDTDKLDTDVIVDENKKLPKVAFPFWTSLKWGLRNIVAKKAATLSVIFASALGLTGVGLIITISSSVTQAFYQAEEASLTEYPVTINSYSKQSREGSEKDYEQYTKEEVIYAEISEYTLQEHYNFMSERFLKYMDDMPKEYYEVKYASSTTYFRLFTQMNETTYSEVSSTSGIFYKGVNNDSFIQEQYTCLKGKYPTAANELAIVVDSYNRIDAQLLYALGYYKDIVLIEQDNRMTFDEILNKTYRYVPNDDYYVYNSGSDIYQKKYSTNNANNDRKNYYDNATYELKVVGILRSHENTDNDLYHTGVVYNEAFEQKVLNDNSHSEIYLKQLEYGLTRDVTTGKAFADDPRISGLTINYNINSKEYYYEVALYKLGGYERETALYYFTKDFTSRGKIEQYFNAYVPDEKVDFTELTYKDYLEKVSYEFTSLLNLMTSVLYIFAIISVLVSGILNAILTYISIHQRTNEIGLLRSLGARKKDIGVMIETESLLTGILGGLVGIGLTAILVYPINAATTDAIYRWNFYLLSKTTFTLSGFQWWVAPILLGLSLLTSLVSALIPAVIASKKDPARAMNE